MTRKILHLGGGASRMLWIIGSILMVAWLVLKFLLHKSGMVHVLLLVAISTFVIQLVQDLRTKAYERSLPPLD